MNLVPKGRLNLGGLFSASVTQWNNPHRIRLIQQGTITITNGNTTNTATITSVDPTQSELILTGITTDPPNIIASGYLTFTNATTITATQTARAADAVYGFTVITYWPGVVRLIQRDTFTIAGGSNSNTDTITEVDTAKAYATLLGWDSGTPGNTVGARIALTNSTTVTGTRVDGGFSVVMTVAYQVVWLW